MSKSASAIISGALILPMGLLFPKRPIGWPAPFPFRISLQFSSWGFDQKTLLCKRPLSASSNGHAHLTELQLQLRRAIASSSHCFCPKKYLTGFPIQNPKKSSDVSTAQPYVLCYQPRFRISARRSGFQKLIAVFVECSKICGLHKTGMLCI